MECCFFLGGGVSHPPPWYHGIMAAPPVGPIPLAVHGGQVSALPQADVQARAGQQVEAGPTEIG